MKNSFSYRNASRTATTIIFVLATLGAEAQQPVASLMAAMAANAQQLRRYAFKQRIETYYKDDLKNAKIGDVHYDSGGERVSIPDDRIVVAGRLKLKLLQL